MIISTNKYEIRKHNSKVGRVIFQLRRENDETICNVKSERTGLIEETTMRMDNCCKNITQIHKTSKSNEIRIISVDIIKNMVLYKGYNGSVNTTIYYNGSLYLVEYLLYMLPKMMISGRINAVNILYPAEKMILPTIVSSEFSSENKYWIFDGSSCQYNENGILCHYTNIYHDTEIISV